MTATPTTALVVKLVAKPETRDEVAEFLAGAVDLANAEPGTTVWFALRTDDTTFWIVDAFPGAAERQAHLDGPIAAALMQNAERLLAAPPEILPADVLAATVPGLGVSLVASTRPGHVRRDAGLNGHTHESQGRHSAR